MNILHSTIIAVAVAGIALVSAGCSSDKTGDGSTTSSSGGTSGSTSSGGTSGTTSSGGTSGTTSSSSSGTGTNCQKSSICINGACKCGSGPNKDKSCQKTDAAAADYCDVFCKFCT